MEYETVYVLMISSNEAMNERSLSSIDIEGRDFVFSFTPASHGSAPLVVILHGHTKSPVASKFKDPNWNVLCPIDGFGYSGWGSWFLGERGEFFWLDAMPTIIRSVYAGERIYFCGSSMGGYGAILHGVLNNARAVYANIPQTWLLGSSYSESGMKKYFEPIFNPGEISPYNDLRQILSPRLPTSFILSGLRWDKKNYLEEQTLPFLRRLCECEINFHSEIQFGAGHSLTHTMAESIAMFQRFDAEIEENYARNSFSRPLG